MITLKSYLPVCFLVAFMLLSFNTVSLSLDENIVGLWLFDEGSGKTASDSSNYGNDGKLKGGAEWVDGKFKKALSFNGKDAYVEVPDSDSLKIEEEITIELWFFPRTVPGELDIIRKHQPNGDTYNYEIYVYADGTISPNLKNILDPFKTAKIGEKDVPFNKWTHIAFTYNGKKVIFYINGNSAFEETVAGKIPTSDGSLYIGCRDGTRRFIDGILDEVCLSNIARTADEIKAHISKGVIGAAAVEKVGKLAVTWAALKG